MNPNSNNLALTANTLLSPQANAELAVLATVSDAAGRKVKAADRLEDTGMDSLEWLGVFVELGIDPADKVETIQDIIDRVIAQC
jgi:hypothetical protein